MNLVMALADPAAEMLAVPAEDPARHRSRAIREITKLSASPLDHFSINGCEAGIVAGMACAGGIDRHRDVDVAVTCCKRPKNELPVAGAAADRWILRVNQW